MKTIRRLYFYAVAIISMEVVTWGVINLLRSIFSANKITNDASTLAQALSLIFVGVPIFLIHWLWAQRASAKDDEEKTASIRAIFFYGILLGTLIPAVQNLLALIDRTFLSAANLYVARAIVGGSQTWVDNLIAIVVNLLIAAYFWKTLQDEWRTLPETESFAEIRRLYRFIWMLYGLLMTVYGAQQALDYAFTLSAGNVLGVLGRETAVNAIALLVVGAPIWFFAWKILQDVLTDFSRTGVLSTPRGSLPAFARRRDRGADGWWQPDLQAVDAGAWRRQENRGVHSRHWRTDFHRRAFCHCLGILREMARPAICI